MVDFLLIELFAIYYGSEIMKRNLYRSAVFTGGQPLRNQILPGCGHPTSTILGIRKLETLDEDTTPVRSLVLTQYWSVTDRPTDGRICCSIYSACKASFAVRCKNVDKE